MNCLFIQTVLFCITSVYGTGSTPPLEKGLHLKILHMAKREPLKAPYFSIASSPYWEQDGI